MIADKRELLLDRCSLQDARYDLLVFSYSLRYNSSKKWLWDQLYIWGPKVCSLYMCYIQPRVYKVYSIYWFYENCYLLCEELHWKFFTKTLIYTKNAVSHLPSLHETVSKFEDEFHTRPRRIKTCRSRIIYWMLRNQRSRSNKTRQFKSQHSNCFLVVPTPEPKLLTVKCSILSTSWPAVRCKEIFTDFRLLNCSSPNLGKNDAS